MGTRLPGPLGYMSNKICIDNGTNCNQRSSLPGPTGTSTRIDRFFPGPILIGKPPREPGKNEDGTVYEDMLYGDAPVMSAPIRRDPVFQLTDEKLKEMGRDLMISVSVGDLQRVALECWDRFCQGTGGTYSSSTLTETVRNEDETFEFVQEFNKKAQVAINACKGDLSNLIVLPIGRYAFDTFLQKATGLGIILHDIWSIKAELINMTTAYDPNQSDEPAWYGTIRYTLTDDFGLDWNDIVQHGNDHKPPTLGFYNTGDRFKAWYVLQHYRDAKPFFVQMVLDYTLSGEDNFPRR